jgi:hypothetical protein
MNPLDEGIVDTKASHIRDGHPQQTKKGCHRRCESLGKTSLDCNSGRLVPVDVWSSCSVNR